MAKIVDPDQLNQGTEVVINTGAKTVQLLIAGNLDDNSPGATSGVTKQALYSFLKEEWLSDSSLNKFRFPLFAIFNASFIWQNGWAPADQQTRDLIRDAGWQEVDGQEWATVISLGAFDNVADQAYYTQAAGFTQATTNFDKTGVLNEPVQIKGTGGTPDNTSYLKLFLREQAKLYDSYEIVSEQGLTALEFIAYRAPLSNGPDIDVAESDANIDSQAPYTGMTIDYLEGALFETAAATTYAAGDVVQDGTGRWAFCTTGGTVVTPGGAFASFGGTSVWEAYAGEIQIGANYYAFNRIIDGNGGSRYEIYEWAMRQLRQTVDINDGTLGSPNQNGFGSVNGEVAEELLQFVGPELRTLGGVGITNFDTNDTNDIAMYDITVDGGGLDTVSVPVTTTRRTFPFVAAGSLEFSANLVSETNADTLYRMYFLNDDAPGDNLGNDFDTANAVVVNDNGGSPIEGQVTTASIAFDYDYDGNTQRGAGAAGTDAPVIVVAQGLNDSQWVEVSFTITRSTGQTIAVNAPNELNYLNP